MWQNIQAQLADPWTFDDLFDFRIESFLLWLGYFPDTSFFSGCPEAQVAVISECLRYNAMHHPEYASYAQFGLHETKTFVNSGRDRLRMRQRLSMKSVRSWDVI
jgi:hypothetical protein